MTPRTWHQHAFALLILPVVLLLGLSFLIVWAVEESVRWVRKYMRLILLPLTLLLVAGCDGTGELLRPARVRCASVCASEHLAWTGVLVLRGTDGCLCAAPLDGGRP